MNKKILEINPHGLSPSYRHMQAFAQAQSLEWEVECLPAFDESLLDGVAGVGIDFAVSDQMFTGIATLPSLVRDLECFDSFLPEDGKWYPRVLLFEALRSLIVTRARDLDIRSCAYVIGDGELARVAAAVMVNLGFAKIYAVSEDEKGLKKMTSLLRRKYIGVEFGEIAANAMTMQMVQGGLLINCANLEKDPTLQNDLSYFNFMRRNAMVLDLNLHPGKTLLLEEALRADLRILAPADVYLEKDLLFLEKCGLQKQFSREDFARGWLEFLKSEISP
jgi:shikimate dehydrogenase